MTDPTLLPQYSVPLPPGVGEPAVTAAWAAHVDAGRLGTAAPRAGGADHGCAGLAAAFGWASATGRFRSPGESGSGGDVASS